MDFFITDTQIGLFAIIGPIIGVALGSWWTSRTQAKAIKASNELQIELARTQHQSQELTRLAEKGGEASVHLVGVLLHFPILPVVVSNAWKNRDETYADALRTWGLDFIDAAAPLIVFGSPELKERLPRDVNVVENGVGYVQEAMKALLHQVEQEGGSISLVGHRDEMAKEIHDRHLEMERTCNELLQLIRVAHPMSSLP